LLTGLFLGYVGGGLLAAVNWSRLGKPERFWPMLVLSITIIPLTLGIIGAFAGSAGLWVGWVASFILTISFSEWQKPAYNTWVVQHDNHRSTLAQSGYGALLMVVAAAIAVIVFYSQLIPVLVSYL
jgi:hypothetical protein